nr:uncharacterized protein CI109_005657 [Kwoniella shandongensis]KAA5526061.1 hypothetical protein CI109_005657 [Kwoniella shandongensis]
MSTSSTEYVYEVVCTTEDNWDRMNDAHETMFTTYSPEQAIAGVRLAWRQQEQEMGDDYFDDVQEGGEGLNFEISGRCPEGENLRVHIERHALPPRPAPRPAPVRAVPAPSPVTAQSSALEPTPLPTVYTLVSTTYAHHTERTGKEKLVGKVVYSSLLEANQAARKYLIVNVCHRKVPKGDDDWGDGLDSEERHVDSTSQAYFGEARFISDRVDTATVEVRPMQVQYPKVTKGKKRASTGEAARPVLKQARIN